MHRPADKNPHFNLAVIFLVTCDSFLLDSGDFSYMKVNII